MQLSLALFNSSHLFHSVSGSKVVFFAYFYHFVLCLLFVFNLSLDPFPNIFVSVECLSHTTVEIRLGFFFIASKNCKANQWEWVKSLSIFLATAS